MNKVCRSCGKTKDLSEFYIRGDRGTPYGSCKDCVHSRQLVYRITHKEKKDAQNREWRLNNKDSIRQSQLRHRNKVRDIVFTHYGGVCVCCGESNPKFLTIDHKNNDGAEHRKSVGPNSWGGRSEVMYRWIIRNGFPDSLQLLCWNCNCGRSTNGGICPHKE